MVQMNKATLGAVIAGVVGIFFATVGFWRTIMIAFLVALGYLIGTYFRDEKESLKPTGVYTRYPLLSM